MCKAVAPKTAIINDQETLMYNTQDQIQHGTRGFKVKQIPETRSCI